LKKGLTSDRKVVEADINVETEEDTIKVIRTDPQLVYVTLIVELDDTGINALVQPEDDTLSD
jgi:hypothetical protein